MSDIRSFFQRMSQRRWFWGLLFGIVLLVVTVSYLSGLMASGYGMRSVSLPSVARHEQEVVKTVEVEKEVVEQVVMDAATWALSPQVAHAASERLIVREGSMYLLVDDTLATRQAIEKMVAEMAPEGAFVVSSNQSGGDETISPDIRMTIRAPSSRFDQVMDRLGGMAKRVLQRSETAQDMTEEYVDLQARLKSLTTARERLQKLMENAATTKDLLDAEQQLTQREAEIEAYQGRLNYLEETARLSKIDISLTPYRPSQPLDNTWRPAETARRALDDLLESLKDFGDFLIVFVIAVLPWLVGIGLVVFLVVRFTRRWRKPKPKPEGDEAPPEK